MAVFAAFLRGVNVGRTGRLKMADLKKALAGQQFTQIETYLQSGNVVFCCDEPAAAAIAKIETVLQTQFAIFNPVILRLPQKCRHLRRRSRLPAPPCSRRPCQSGDAESYMYSFVQPRHQKKYWVPAGTAKLRGAQLHLAGNDLSLLLPGGIRNSKLAQKSGKIGVLPQCAI